MAVTRFPGTTSGGLFFIRFSSFAVVAGDANTIVKARFPIPALSRILGASANAETITAPVSILIVSGTGAPDASNTIVGSFDITAADTPVFGQATAGATLDHAQYDIKVDGVRIIPSGRLLRNVLLTARAVAAAGKSATNVLVTVLLFVDLAELDAAA